MPQRRSDGDEQFSLIVLPGPSDTGSTNDVRAPSRLPNDHRDFIVIQVGRERLVVGADVSEENISLAVNLSGQ